MARRSRASSRRRHCPVAPPAIHPILRPGDSTPAGRPQYPPYTGANSLEPARHVSNRMPSAASRFRAGVSSHVLPYGPIHDAPRRSRTRINDLASLPPLSRCPNGSAVLGTLTNGRSNGLTKSRRGRSRSAFTNRLPGVSDGAPRPNCPRETAVRPAGAEAPIARAAARVGFAPRCRPRCRPRQAAGRGRSKSLNERPEL